MPIRNHQECKAAEGLLQPYLENSLNRQDTIKLLNHLDKCSECQDELEIRFLLAEGLKRLESGETMNMKAELHDRLRHSRREVVFREYLSSIANLLTLVSYILLALICFIYYLEFM